MKRCLRIIQMWLCEDKLNRRTGHFPFAVRGSKTSRARALYCYFSDVGPGARKILLTSKEDSSIC